MSTDDTRFSVPAVWSVLYSGLKHTPWESEDAATVIHDTGMSREKLPAADALKDVYDFAEKNWSGAFITYEAPLAVLKATAHHHGGLFLTPAQVKEMARSFAVYYDDPEEPLQDFLDAHNGEMPYAWLNETGQREIQSAVRRPSEIWIEDEKLSGVWVFNAPDADIHQMLARARLLENPPPAPVERAPE